MHHIIETENFPLFYLSRPACGVCQVLKPRFAALADEYPAMNAYYVNLDENEEIGGQFSIYTIPGILVYAQGKEAIREARNFSVDEIHNRLDRLASLMG
jgi:thioredoxin-like negative regulator of GroEL